MSFNQGDQVSLKGYAIPMTVEIVDGDDVTVTRIDAKGKRHRETYKVGALHPTPKRRALTFRF